MAAPTNIQLYKTRQTFGYVAGSGIVPEWTPGDDWIPDQYVTRIIGGTFGTGGSISARVCLEITDTDGNVTTYVNREWGSSNISIYKCIKSFRVYTTGSGTSGSSTTIAGLEVQGYVLPNIIVDRNTTGVGISSSDPSMPQSWTANLTRGHYITGIHCGRIVKTSGSTGTCTVEFTHENGLVETWNPTSTSSSGTTINVEDYASNIRLYWTDLASTGSHYIESITIYAYKEEKPMPTPGAQIIFKSGLYSAYNALTTKDQNTLYFCSDTQQIFLGSSEYTKSLVVLDAAPTESTPGNIGQLYAYNGNLYACTAINAGVYTYVRVANVNDVVGSVTSVGAGDGLETAAGDDNPITSTGTIKHAVPSGASTHSSSASTAVSPDFGDTFELETVDTDAFGHVVGFHTTTVTLPANPDTNTTYTLSSTVDGELLLTPSEGNAQVVTIHGWSDLAKKSDIATVFNFKGTVATVADLPTTGRVGDVYHVTAANAEYVCIQASTTDPAADAVWEELGTDIDLSGYIQKVSGATAGNVATLTADGSVADSTFTLGCSVPSTAVFTDTTYEDATTAVAGLMSTADKVKLDGIEAGGEVNIIDSISVASTAIAPDADKNVNIELSSFGLTVDASELNQLDGKLATSSNVLTVDGNITGHAASASTATYDGAGNEITQTYATKTDLQWQSI